ncbi:MAG: hypothetical protein N2316_05180 [Spirochaetes bacterium]|nr:hypothetical protein [Spirochaetota bacterium]
MKFVAIIVILVVAFSAYFVIVKIDDDEYGLLLNKETDEVEQLCLPGYNFAIKKIAFWRYSMYYGKITSSTIIEIRVPLPGLSELESRHYAVDMKLQMKYALDVENAQEDMLLKKDVLLQFLKTVSKESFESSMLPYWYPIYNNINLERNAAEVVEKSFAAIKERCGKMGIKIIEIALLTPLRIPTLEIYREGLMLAADLRKIENEYKKEQLLLENKLKKDEMEQKKYLENLRRIASVVKNNPDLLKYLYITGFSKNVTTIIASERTGMPFGLDFGKKDAAKVGESDVDNLR